LGGDKKVARAMSFAAWPENPASFKNPDANTGVFESWNQAKEQTGNSVIPKVK
jgi:hypothetical protein